MRRAICVFALTVCCAQSALSQSVEPSETTKARLQPIVKGILAAWDKFDVVCLGEGHGNVWKNTSGREVWELPIYEGFLRAVRKVNMTLPHPGRIFSVAAFHFPDEGRRVFNLSGEPALIPITGTEKENLPAKGLFEPRNENDNATLRYRFDAIVYYGALH